MPEFIPLDQVQWKTVHFLERPDETFEYAFELPEPLASWDVFATWERARFHSMRDNLKQGDILFDVGTEQGWCNLIYAQFVGPEKIALIEPTPEFWPNIRATWFKNYGAASPKAFYNGLLSDTTTDQRLHGFDLWPTAAAPDRPLIDRNKYQYIHEHSDGVQEMRLDDLVERSGVVPDALTVDVEGAELLVVKGGVKTLVEHHPKLWVSVHPDLSIKHHAITADEFHAFMDSLGYRGTHLSTDHEEHWLYQ